jgi:hypothetical protein
MKSLRNPRGLNGLMVTVVIMKIGVSNAEWFVGEILR